MLTRRALLAAAVTTPMRVTLRRGINLTNWFRFPATPPDAYLSDAALATLVRAGFDFARLAVAPAALTDRAALRRAIARLHAARLSVIVDLHPTDWPPGFVPLEAAWTRLAPALADTDPARTLPEIVNEPTGDPAAWAVRQDAVLRLIRHVLPTHTIVCTGTDWGSLDGLRAAPSPADRNTIMSLHFYEPPTLTTLAAAWRPDAAPRLMDLPFPSRPCSGSPESLARAYCAESWSPERLRARVALAAEWRARTGVPVLAGEFGASARLNAPARLAWITAAREAFEAQAIPWALWGLEDVHGFDLPRPPPRNPVLAPDLLAALGLHRPERR